MLCIINCQTRVWREYLQQKYQNKNTLQGFEGDTYSKNSKYKEKIFFLSFLYIKGLNMYISIGLKLQEKCRGLKVIVTGLLPRDSEWSQRRKKINLITYYLEKLCCDRFDDFYFMKQDDDWTDEDGKLDKKLYYADQLHLMEAGNRKFACSILKILSKLMQDEKLGNSSDERKAHYLFEFNSDVNHCKPVIHSKPIRPVSYSKSVHPVRPINHC